MASSNADQNWRLAAKAIVAVAVSLLHAFGREGILPFSRNEAYSQMGSVRPRSHWKARRSVLPGGQDYKPVQEHFVNIFSTEPRPDLTRVGPVPQYIFLDAFLEARRNHGLVPWVILVFFRPQTKGSAE